MNTWYEVYSIFIGLYLKKKDKKEQFNLERDLYVQKTCIFVKVWQCLHLVSCLFCLFLLLTCGNQNTSAE